MCSVHYCNEYIHVPFFWILYRSITFWALFNTAVSRSPFVSTLTLWLIAQSVLKSSSLPQNYFIRIFIFYSLYWSIRNWIEQLTRGLPRRRRPTDLVFKKDEWRWTSEGLGGRGRRSSPLRGQECARTSRSSASMSESGPRLRQKKMRAWCVKDKTGSLRLKRTNWRCCYPGCNHC